MARHFNRDDYDTDEEAIADGLFAIASALRDLGNADAATPMGAIENLAKELNEGLQKVAWALGEREKS